MKTPDIFDLYTNYLITSFSYTTATGLSGLVDNAISHDPVLLCGFSWRVSSKIKTPSPVSISLTVFLITFPSSLEVKPC
jgi:hypothetical protein